MNKITKTILLFSVLLVFLTACVQTNDNYKITARDGQVYYFTGECIASVRGEFVVTCYKENELVLSIQATSFEVLKDE